MSNREQFSKMLSIRSFETDYQHSVSDQLFTNHNKECHDANAPKQGYQLKQRFLWVLLPKKIWQHGD
jgi:hypothetical protein